MMMNGVTRYTLHVTRNAQSALATIFVIGGIVLLVGITLAYFTMSFLNSTSGFRNANRAFALASSGVQDAFLQLARNKDFADTSGYCVPLSCGNNSATITVTQNNPIAGEVRVVSTATVALITRRLEAIAALDQTTGQVTVISLKTL